MVDEREDLHHEVNEAGVVVYVEQPMITKNTAIAAYLIAIAAVVLFGNWAICFGSTDLQTRNLLVDIAIVVAVMVDVSTLIFGFLCIFWAILSLINEWFNDLPD